MGRGYEKVNQKLGCYSRVKGARPLKFGTLCEVIAAVHLSVYVKGPFEQRGGLMLVAPPGHLKTTAAEILSEFERTLIISDLTVKSVIGMRDDLIGGNIYTLVFSDYAKIHKRHNSVSSNIEGIVMGLAEEGFRKSGFADQRIQALPARATIIGCMTPKFSETMEEMWLDNGFYRRFLWCRYVCKDPERLEDAIAEWRRAELDGNFVIRVPTSRDIPYTLTKEEVALLRHSLRFLKDKKLPFILSQKILCVLKWKFSKQNPKLPLEFWNDFSPSLTPDGAILTMREDR